MSLENTQNNITSSPGEIVKFPMEVNDNNPELSYEANNDFNQYLDDEYGLIIISGSHFQASKILYDLENETYRIALQEFRAQEIENFKETVFDEFPTPIAYNFYRFERGYDNENQRRDFLRDTWESIIFLIYAIVVGEFRCSKLSIDASTKIKMQEVLSDSLDAKLSIVAKLLQLALDQGIKLSSLKVTSLDLIEKLRELNRVRNGFSHSGAMSEEQARKFILANQGDVLSVLQDCKNLNSLKLLRFNKNEGKASHIRCEVFNGHSMNRTYETFLLTSEQVTTAFDYLDRDNILINIDNHIFSISPFFHFKLTDSGHQTRLCCYKKKKGEPPEQKFIYEVIGDALEIDFEAANFSSVVDEIRSLLPDLSRR